MRLAGGVEVPIHADEPRVIRMALRHETLLFRQRQHRRVVGEDVAIQPPDTRALGQRGELAQQARTEALVLPAIGDDQCKLARVDGILNGAVARFTDRELSFACAHRGH